MTEQDRDQDIQTVRELLEGARSCMFTTRAADGGLVSRPMAVQETDFDGDLWFFAAADSDKVSQLRADPNVNLGFAQSGTWVSLRGRAEIVEDPALKREMAGRLTTAWLQAEPEDPSAALIKVVTDGAEYWSGDGARTVLSMLRARVTGQRPHGGQNESVDL